MNRPIIKTDEGLKVKQVPEILMVDDREENLVALEALLEGCGAELHRAASGNEALSLMLKLEFALVLLDVQMPGMDGFEVAELMRGNEVTRHVPIIFVTAISKEQRHIFKGYEAGAVDFLPKPLEPRILNGKVNVFLDLWRRRRDLLLALEENERLTAKLRQQAEFDKLTGLPNRALFHDRLQQAVLLSERAESPGALMFIDLDRFKWVNDTLGHEAGDQLLVQAAERLSACVRKSDTVARLGGDEFTVILLGVLDESLAELVAQNILTELARPFTLDGKDVHISGSIGITLFPHDGLKLEDLLKHADTAMYRAKESGRNAFRFFTREMNAHVEQRVALADRLRNALEREEFRLHYQPKMDLRTGRILGMEALVRWEPQKGELVPPNDFIPLAEEIGLIVPLGRWVLNQACRQNKAWQAAGFDALTMSVNISARQFNDKDDLIKTVQEALTASELAPEHLELEITESLVMEKVDAGLEIMETLRGMGVQISVDDFGTGYSSLASLKRFPIQTLKIDKSFIRDLTLDSDDSAIVSAIISMADKLSLNVIAEGVETPEQLEFLKKEGCAGIQGYHVSRPAPPEGCLDVLKAQYAPTPSVD